MPEQDCPLCHIARNSRKFKLLYGAPVCHKCYYAFANRRQVAYLVDFILYRLCIYLVGTAIVTLSLMPSSSFALNSFSHPWPAG